MLNNWYKKEKPIQGMMGMGGGATGYLVGGAGGSGSFNATGGNQLGGPSGFPANGFIYHTFTSDGNFVVASGNGTVEVLIVGGGGGGSDYNGPGNAGGGGGAGGLVHHASLAISTGTYPVVVGAGGPDNPSPNGANIAANGEDSTAFGMVAKGGGGAGGYTSGGRPGGSGGGGGTPGGSGSGPSIQSSQNTPFAPDPNFNQYGHAGGNGSSGPGQFGGGGGAGAAGTPDGGAGGVGRQYPQFVGNNIGLPAVNFTNGYYAGGGGGGKYPGGNPGSGGLGGGGGPNNNPSGASSNTQPIPGTNGTGGGGAGGSLNNSGGTGGNGIVIIRYSE